MEKPKFLTRYCYKRVSTAVEGKSATDPQYLKDCDINEVIRRYNLGMEPRTVGGQYGDFSDVGDFSACLEKVNRVNDLFSSLPAEVRARFGHDAKAFAAFALNPENVQECIKLGIFTERQKTRTAVDAIDELKEQVTRQGTSTSTSVSA